MKVLYFGCVNQAGHYLWLPGPVSAYREKTPWGPEGWSLDGTIAPKGQPVRVAAIQHKDGWTAMGFWDKSVDERPGSNSVFIADGDYTFEEMLSHAKTYFPEIMDRIGTITEYGGA